MATATLDDIRDSLAQSGRHVLEARFYLSEVTRRLAWQTDPGEPKVQVGVTFNAAKSGIFGKLTPSGQISMSVQSPGAAKLLDEIQRTSIVERGQQPVFRVYFVEEADGEGE